MIQTHSQSVVHDRQHLNSYYNAAGRLRGTRCCKPFVDRLDEGENAGTPHLRRTTHPTVSQPDHVAGVHDVRIVVKNIRWGLSVFHANPFLAPRRSMEPFRVNRCRFPVQLETIRSTEPCASRWAAVVPDPGADDHAAVRGGIRYQARHLSIGAEIIGSKPQLSMRQTFSLASNHRLSCVR